MVVEYFLLKIDFNHFNHQPENKEQKCEGLNLKSVTLICHLLSQIQILFIQSKMKI